MDTQNIMRNYIILAEDFVLGSNETNAVAEPEKPEEKMDDTKALLAELNETAQRLRSHMETDDSNPDQSYGVELGMQRAADLLEAIIRRFDGDNRG